jgi:hypothetical protein
MVKQDFPAPGPKTLKGEVIFKVVRVGEPITTNGEKPEYPTLLPATNMTECRIWVGDLLDYRGVVTSETDAPYFMFVHWEARANWRVPITLTFKGGPDFNQIVDLPHATAI